MPCSERPRSLFLGLLPLPERQAVAQALRTETVGGLVLPAAAVAALVWANSPWSDAYERTTAALPVVAAVCGMAVPAALHVAVVGFGGGSRDGWAVPSPPPHPSSPPRPPHPCRPRPRHRRPPVHPLRLPALPGGGW